MNSNKKAARTSGILYFLVVIFGIFCMRYVPSKIVIWNDPASTIANLVEYETLFRFGIIGSVLTHICFILLPLSLFRLLSPVNKNHAYLMVVFALISIPVSYVFLVKQFDILELIADYNSLDIINAKQIQSDVMSAFVSLNRGDLISQVFWGLWLFPFGLLIFKSGFLPKILGILLMLGCMSYLLDSIGRTLISNYYEIVNTNLILLPASVGEIGTCLWLLIMGAKERTDEKLVNIVDEG